MSVYVNLDAFIEHWDGVRMVTLELLGNFTDEDLSYRLVPAWRSVGQVFHHIGGQQFYVARGVFEERWEPDPGEPDEDWDTHQGEVIHSVAALHNWLTDTQGKLRSWSRDADPHLLSDIRDDNPWHEGMRGWLLLHHPYQDELHHRGQLYAAARLLKRDVPKVYAEEHHAWWGPRKGG